MASGPGPLYHEGKILASAADLCGFCDQQLAIKHCPVCAVDLCVVCVKGHNKLPISRDHSLTDIVRGDETPKFTTATAKNGVCTKHSDQQFTIVCKDCVELGCDSCKTDHGRHSIQTLDNDPILCHRVVTKNIQHLLDDVHELEEIKSVLEGQICAYEDAIVRADQWEIDLLKMVKEKAAKIRHKLKDLKDERFKQLSDKVNGLMAKLTDMDRTISQLTAIRRSMDFQVLSKELSSSQELIAKLERYKEDVLPLPEPISVDDVLKNGDKIKDVDEDLDVMFTVGDLRTVSKGPIPVAEWRFTHANGGKDLSVHGKNHVTMTNATYGPGPHGEAQGAVVAPNSGTESMIVMNPDKKLRFSGEMTFFMNLFVEGTGSPGFLFIYDTGVTSSKQFTTFVHVHGDHTRLQIYSEPFFDTPQILTPSSWNKIAVVFKPTAVSVYVNGALALTENVSLDLSKTHQGHLHFGRQPGCYGFEGRIASCKFYDVALDENAIKEL